MTTRTYSYRRSSNLKSSPDNDASLRSKLEQARSQRTGFYRRLAETGARAQADEDGTEVEFDVDAETRGRSQRLDISSPFCEVVSSVSSTNSALIDQVPEPRSR